MKILIVIIITSIFSFPVFAESTQSGWVTKVEKKVTDEQIESTTNLTNNIQDIINNVKEGRLGKIADIFVSLTTLIICIGAICVISGKVIKSVFKGEVIDLSTLLMPFLFALIIYAYQPLTQGVDWCINGFDKILITVSSESLTDIIKKREEKSKLVEKIEKKQEELEANIGLWGEITTAFKKYYDKAVHGLVYGSIMLASFCAAFLTKLLGTALTLILYVLGPVTIALSVIPAFADNWKNWLSKYIWVQLFMPVCRIISWVLQEVELSILTLDIERLGYCLSNFEKTGGGIEVAGGGFMEGTAYLGFMIVGIMLYLAVPSIASWIINTSGGGVMTAINTAGTYAMTKALGASKSMAGGSWQHGVKPLAKGAAHGVAKGAQGIAEIMKKI